LVRCELSRQLISEGWILFDLLSISRQFRSPDDKSHTATKLGAASLSFNWEVHQQGEKVDGYCNVNGQAAA